MKPSQLSELHVATRIEDGAVRVLVTHLPTGESVEEVEPLASISPLAEKAKAKKRAYSKLAKLLTERGL